MWWDVWSQQLGQNSEQIQLKTKYFEASLIHTKTNLMLNQTYQHKKGPPKMVKDLKYGANAHLRQSLLDITQIENLNKIFIGRKTHYRIHDLKSDSNHNDKTPDQPQTNSHQPQFVLSPQQNLQLIKKLRVANKMKDKINQMFKQQQVRKYKLRKPVIHNLLQDFKTSFRLDDQPKYRQALKNSQKQLEHIKINAKKRVSSQYLRTDTAQSRGKFLSIKTSKPTVNKNYFPSFNDFVKGKYQVKEKPLVTIDIGKIESLFEGLMITEPMLGKNQSKKVSRDENARGRQSQSITPVLGGTRVTVQSPSIPTNTETDESLGFDCLQCTHEPRQQFLTTQTHQQPRHRQNTRSKSAVNPNISFTRSQQSSRKIISAMQSYYSTKRQKNQQCDTIVEYMKKDRPLTSHLRRKNYQVIGGRSIEELDNYRQKTEEERMRLLERNYNFYIYLLRIFQHCKEEEIAGSLSVLNRLKEFFQSEYVLFVEDVARICCLHKGETEDFGVRVIRQNLLEFAKKDSNFSAQNQEEYEML